MVATEVSSPTLGRLIANFSRAPSIAGEEIRAATRDLAPLARAAVVAKARARVRRRTGRYEASIQARITSGQGPSGLFAELSVTSNVPHAVFIERGTRAHRIRAKRQGGKLRFPIGGRFLFRESVWHPGTKPQWVFRDAGRDFQATATRRYAAGLGNVTRRLGSR